MVKSHGEMLECLKTVYKEAKDNNLVWYDFFVNNMPNRGKKGIYTYCWFERNGKYDFVKYTIQYDYRCDEKMVSHPEEGVKYYILYKLVKRNINNKKEIPAPSNISSPFYIQNENVFDNSIVNELGTFCFVFEDEETAKKVVCRDLLLKVYPSSYLLSKEDEEELKRFIDEKNK